MGCPNWDNPYLLLKPRIKMEGRQDPAQAPVALLAVAVADTVEPDIVEPGTEVAVAADTEAADTEAAAADSCSEER